MPLGGKKLDLDESCHIGEPAAMLTEKFLFVNITHFVGLCSD